MSNFLIPVLFSFLAVSCLILRKDGYSALCRGAKDGLQVTLRILPPLIGLLSSIYMLRASGALDTITITHLLAPLFSLVGLPPETAPLVMIRPISGSGALAVGSDLIRTYGPDSHIGRVTAVMMGSTETTFYTIAVYFGAAGIHRTRYTLPAALTADIAGFLFSALAVRIFF